MEFNKQKAYNFLLECYQNKDYKRNGISLWMKNGHCSYLVLKLAYFDYLNKDKLNSEEHDLFVKFTETNQPIEQRFYDYTGNNLKQQLSSLKALAEKDDTPKE